MRTNELVRRGKEEFGLSDLRAQRFADLVNTRNDSLPESLQRALRDSGGNRENVIADWVEKNG